MEVIQPGFRPGDHGALPGGRYYQRIDPDSAALAVTNRQGALRGGCNYSVRIINQICKLPCQIVEVVEAVVLYRNANGIGGTANRKAEVPLLSCANIACKLYQHLFKRGRCQSRGGRSGLHRRGCAGRRPHSPELEREPGSCSIGPFSDIETA